jgi:hypothetical protein
MRNDIMKLLAGLVIGNILPTIRGPVVVAIVHAIRS